MQRQVPAVLLRTVQKTVEFLQVQFLGNVVVPVVVQRQMPLAVDVSVICSDKFQQLPDVSEAPQIFTDKFMKILSQW